MLRWFKLLWNQNLRLQVKGHLSMLLFQKICGPKCFLWLRQLSGTIVMGLRKCGTSFDVPSHPEGWKFLIIWFVCSASVKIRPMERIFEDYHVEVQRTRSRAVRFSLAILSAINMHLDVWIQHPKLISADIQIKTVAYSPFLIHISRFVFLVDSIGHTHFSEPLHIRP